jgi:hypothetical protein
MSEPTSVEIDTSANDVKKIFVGGPTKQTTQNDLIKHFSSYGWVTSIDLLKSTNSSYKKIIFLIKTNFSFR